MEILHTLIDFCLHLDHHMAQMIAQYGTMIYAILFLIIFCETGLVITPYLPGDSLLFVLGAFAAKGDLNLLLLWILLFVAAVLGDAVNYFIGSRFKSTFLSKGRIAFIKQKHMDQTEAFFQKYGTKTIILARFVPLIRTLAPFMAGIGTMPYRTFFTFNVIGALLWVSVGLAAGYIFGRLPWVEKNFSLVILGVVVLSIIPIILEFLKNKKDR